MKQGFESISVRNCTKTSQFTHIKTSGFAYNCAKKNENVSNETKRWFVALVSD